MLKLLLAPFAVLALGLVTAAPATAFPGANGVLAFESTIGGLQTIGADGQGLASIPGTDGLGSPVFSPSGTRLAAATGGGLSTLDLSGTLAAVGIAGADPTWSPDGARLAYASAGDIWAVNANGSGTPVPLTGGPDFDGTPSWSATGRIAFVRNGVGDKQVWSMAADGNDLRQVSAIGDVETQRPAWSPDGKKIAFGIDDGKIVDLYVSDTTVPASLANDKRITVNGSSAISNGYPSWSPDGTRIAFTSSRTGVDQIWTTAAPGGGGELQVTTTGGRRPDWQSLALPQAPPVTVVIPTRPAPPAPAPRPALKVSTVAQLPSAKTCVSRRRIAIRLRVPRDAGVREVVVRVNGKRVASRTGARLRSTVDLRSLPKGRFKVEVTVRLTDGSSVKETRRYRTCAPKRR